MHLPCTRSALLVVVVVSTGCRTRAAPEPVPAVDQPAMAAVAPAPLPTVAASAVAPLPADPAPVGSTKVVSDGGTTTTATGTTRFIAIGDFGITSDTERRVADFVLAQRFDVVITLGDNNYPSGSADTIDVNIGKYYASLIFPYRGHFGPGAKENRFFPSLGNHDWMTAGARPYLDYFTLPGNERYYEFERGNVHFFAIDSDPHEPDGIDADSVQAKWLEARVRASRAPFQVVYMHHPPYSSARHGPTPALQWPYRAWGIDLVLAGHDHTYERLEVGGLTYVVNGLGGNSAYGFREPLPGSVIRFNQAHGALLVEATANELRGRFATTDGNDVDTFVVRR